MKHLIETVAWLASVRPRSLASEAMKQCLAASLLAMLAIGSAQAYAEGDGIPEVPVVEDMPEDCERGADGVITCNGLSREAWCYLHGSGAETFCYGGSSGGGGQMGTFSAPSCCPANHSRARRQAREACEKAHGTRCHYTNGAYVSSGLRPICPCGDTRHHHETGWRACPTQQRCDQIDQMLTDACEYGASGLGGGAAAVVCWASIPATAGIGTIFACGAAGSIATTAAVKISKVCH